MNLNEMDKLVGGGEPELQQEFVQAAIPVVAGIGRAALAAARTPQGQAAIRRVGQAAAHGVATAVGNKVSQHLQKKAGEGGLGWQAAHHASQHLQGESPVHEAAPGQSDPFRFYTPDLHLRMAEYAANTQLHHARNGNAQKAQEYGQKAYQHLSLANDKENAERRSHPASNDPEMVNHQGVWRPKGRELTPDEHEQAAKGYNTLAWRAHTRTNTYGMLNGTHPKELSPKDHQRAHAETHHYRALAAKHRSGVDPMAPTGQMPQMSSRDPRRDPLAEMWALAESTYDPKLPFLG